MTVPTPTIEKMRMMMADQELMAAMDVMAASAESPEWTMVALELEQAKQRCSKVTFEAIGERAKRPREENVEAPGAPVKKKRAREENAEPAGAAAKKKLRYDYTDCKGCKQGDMGAPSQRDHVCMRLHLHPDPAMRALSRAKDEVPVVERALIEADERQDSSPM